MRDQILNIERWLKDQAPPCKATSEVLQCFVSRNIPDWESSPPVDPSIFAKKLGCDVLVEDVPSARLEVTRYSKVIRIPKNAPSHLQRFLMAHELAHLLFLKLDHNGVSRAYVDESIISTSARTRKKALHRLEHFCDKAAGVILLPNAAIEGTLRRAKNIDLQFLLDTAGQFDVGPSVLFDRLVDCEKLPRYPGRVLLRYCDNRFTRQDTKWRVAARALPKSEFFTDFPWLNESLDRLAIRIPPPGAASSEMSFLLDRQGQSWQCEIEKSDQDAAWALARFTNRACAPKPRI